MAAVKAACDRDAQLQAGTWTIWEELDYQDNWGRHISEGGPGGALSQNAIEEEHVNFDPYIDYTSIADRGTQAKSTATGAVAAAVPLHMTDVGGGGDGNVTWYKTYNLAVGQSLTIGALARYDSAYTSYDLSAFPGNSESQVRNIFTAAGLVRYWIGSTFFAGGVAGQWGDGNYSGTVTTGNFNSHGLMAGLSAGHVFTLYDDRIATEDSALLVTKAPARPVDGTALFFSVSAYLNYADDTIDGFTDTTGFAWGDETTTYWQAGGQAMLYERIVMSGYRITPFVGENVSSQFLYSQTLAIPSQATTAADTIVFGTPQTFWSTRLGVDVVDPNGWDYGIAGFYSASAEYNTLGIRGYFHMPIARWFGLGG